MQQKNVITKYWPTIVGEFYNPEHDQIKKKLLTFFDDYKKKNASSRKASENFNLYESSYYLYQESNPDLQKVLQFMSKCVFHVYKKASHHYISERGSDKQYRVEIDAAWFITYESGGFVAPHTHDHCSWSAVYYVQAGEDSNKKNGATFLEAPNSRLSSDIGSESFQHSLEEFIPTEGKLIVWPSYIVHGSYPAIGKVKKAIISANFSIKLI